MPLELFAGPIVRRVTPDKVCVWFAARSLAEAEVSVLSGRKRLGAAVSRSIDLKGALFIHLAEITPDRGRFPINAVLQYQIGVPSKTGYDYADFDAYVISAQLAYGNEKFYSLEGLAKAVADAEKPNLPTFIIPAENSRFNFAFGSCRKIHDKGPDALAGLDPLLSRNQDDVSKRPAAVLLGGDQIYADDVDVKYVLPAVIDLSRKLGLIEQLPRSATHTISSLTRNDIVKRAGFTSGAAVGHLLSFGEFVAMYGLVLNGDNWRGYATGEQVSEFLTSLGAIRRVLANTATYMMFDDHDVTDDWFITNQWRNAVLDDPNGKRIIANAMAAYFLFQGWGNAPENFNYAELKKCIEDHVNLGSDKKLKSPFDDVFLRQSWEYAAPTIPVVYFLNTRTDRDGIGFPPVLKSKKAWGKTDISVPNKNFPFVLVTPGPLVTFPGIDRVQAAAAKLPESGFTGVFGADFESWFANVVNYRLLFDYFLSKTITKVVVVSGDVHYGFSAVFSLYNRQKLLGQAGGHQVNCLQITSSGLKNSASVLGSQATVPYAGRLYHLIFSDDTLSVACDKLQAEQKVRANRTERIVGGSASTIFPEFAFLDNHLFRLAVTGALPSNFEYRPLPAAEYPDLILELQIKSLSPLTADYLGPHNYVNISMFQNDITYSFNNTMTYSYQL